MIYIERDAQGDIANIEFSPGPNREEISLHDSKLTDFIKNSDNSDELIKSVLNRLDLDMVRVIEDVVDIMIDKNLMLFTDLPVPVQNKFLFKRKMRNLTNETSMIHEEEDILNF